MFCWIKARNSVSQWRKSVRVHISDALSLGGNLANRSDPKGKQESSKLIMFFFSLRIPEKGQRTDYNSLLQFTYGSHQACGSEARPDWPRPSGQERMPLWGAEPRWPWRTWPSTLTPSPWALQKVRQGSSHAGWPWGWSRAFPGVPRKVCPQPVC